MEEALARRGRSQALLRAREVPVYDNLPVIEDSTQALRRGVEEIADRAMALLAVALKGEGLEKQYLDDLVSDLTPHFSPKEQAFLNDELPSQHVRVQFSWRYEAAWALLWSLTYVESLEWPDKICDVPAAVMTIRRRDRTVFVSGAILRPMSEILDQADLVYRQHWATRDAQINGQPMPAGLDNGIVMERHYAFNWLIGYMGDDWDDITTDT
jgi:hypothetical protein